MKKINDLTKAIQRMDSYGSGVKYTTLTTKEIELLKVFLNKGGNNV